MPLCEWVLSVVLLVLAIAIKLVIAERLLAPASAPTSLDIETSAPREWS